jgi:hypothetical protein
LEFCNPSGSSRRYGRDKPGPDERLGAMAFILFALKNQAEPFWRAQTPLAAVGRHFLRRLFLIDGRQNLPQLARQGWPRAVQRSKTLALQRQLDFADAPHLPGSCELKGSFQFSGTIHSPHLLWLSIEAPPTQPYPG